MLKNLKSLFIIDVNDENPKKETPKKESIDKENKSIENRQTVSSISSTVSSSGMVDTKIIEKLLQAIENNNLEGFDYLEFKKSIKALEKIPMDEATKYRSAFATASTMGVTLDKLLKTVNHYIGVLDRENTTFSNAFKGQLAEKVSGKEKEIAQFENITKEKSEKIKQLTKEITKHQQQIAELKAKISDSKYKIDKTQNDFKISFDHLKSQFEADIIKMKEYLK